MRLKRTIPLLTIFLATFCLLVIQPNPGGAQDLTIGTIELYFQEGSSPSFEDLTSENPTVIITPPEGAAITSVRMKSATQDYFLEGKKVSIKRKQDANTADFHLEGNGKIQWNENILIGPKEIIFDSTSNVMKLYGTPKNPASIKYKGGASGFNFNGKADWFFVNLKSSNGSWTPSSVNSGPWRGGNPLGGTAKNSSSEKIPNPKITPPKK